ncbi:peptidyl-prolyl cis-trans isomerase B (cyclophilin B) [Aquiflexum balticum DSM 16537]|uniref:Peptidyl-prolyl cis-trans isomerase n=1 Tax=Aquiflexum balticum DSM 16537 TaxID=758820 RepID=A0A1W2H2N0_9BACT|nr:peptidylprolyl isomerase [Aquiflexum balticum]SMD43205.1 peptidyl-prolyl cis-trans isomerase B (cyclophilin B) [Aquiflexum balticum DSM 16537]
MKRLNLVSLTIFGMLFFSCKSEKDHLIKIQTRHGDMYAILFDETPKHKQNFIDLAETGRFDSTEFHRIIPEFMIQGGDVFGKEMLPKEEWYTIPSEIIPGLIHSKGMIAAARQGDNVNPERNSSGTQFYIVQGKVYSREELVTDMKLLSETFFKYIQLSSNIELKETYSRLYEMQEFDSLTQILLGEKQNLESFYGINLEKSMTSEQIEVYTTVGGAPHLDNEYTVFGQVVKGLEVIDKIANEKTGRGDKPLEPVLMKVTVEELSKAKISKEYGHSY